MERPSESTLRARWGYVLCMLGFAGVFLFFGYKALAGLPPFGEPLMNVSSYYIDNALDLTGAANIVSAILLDFRAYDTLGELTILFASIVGAAAVLRKIGRKKPS